MAKAELQLLEAQDAGSSAVSAATRSGRSQPMHCDQDPTPYRSCSVQEGTCGCGFESVHADCAARCGPGATSTDEQHHHNDHPNHSRLHRHDRTAHGHDERSTRRADRGECEGDSRHGAAPVDGSPLATWEVELKQREDVEFTTNLSQWLRERADVAESWKWKHVAMRDALESSGAVQPVRFYLAPSRNALYCTWNFSQFMVGHPEVVHGGATAFAFDETFGVLFAMLGVGHGFTANISVNYRKPLPAATMACMHVALDRVEGRKYFLCGSIRSDPSESADVFSEATALFIIPRPAATG